MEDSVINKLKNSIQRINEAIKSAEKILEKDPINNNQKNEHHG
jgi:hypothetical protein